MVVAADDLAGPSGGSPSRGGAVPHGLIAGLALALGVLAGGFPGVPGGRRPGGAREVAPADGYRGSPLAPSRPAPATVLTADNRRTVGDFLGNHALVGHMEYLLGSRAELGRVRVASNVGSQRDADQSELVAHSALVSGISAHGPLPTPYLAEFNPADIVHDLPLLASR